MKNDKLWALPLFLSLLIAIMSSITVGLYSLTVARYGYNPQLNFVATYLATLVFFFALYVLDEQWVP
jgi:hypothetical protein